MSVLEGSNNNSSQAPPPDIPNNNALVHPYTRDPDYYYHDGNIVFLVKDVLFKVRRSFSLSYPPNEFMLSTFKATSVDP